MTISCSEQPLGVQGCAEMCAEGACGCADMEQHVIVQMVHSMPLACEADLTQGSQSCCNQKHCKEWNILNPDEAQQGAAPRVPFISVLHSIIPRQQLAVTHLMRSSWSGWGCLA